MFLQFHFVVFFPSHTPTPAFRAELLMLDACGDSFFSFCWQVFPHKASLVAFHYPLLINLSPRAHSVQ